MARAIRLHKTSMMTHTKEMIILGLVTATMGQAKSSAFWDGDRKVSLGTDALTCSFDWKKARDRRFYSTIFTRAVMFCLVILVMVLLWLRQAGGSDRGTLRRGRHPRFPCASQC